MGEHSDTKKRGGPKPTEPLMRRVSVLDRDTARRAKTLGALGESLAPSYLKRAGFTSIRDLNEGRRNHPFADFMATRRGITYIISVKTRNKYQARSGSLNDRYKLHGGAPHEKLIARLCAKHKAVAAWMAIQIDGDRFSAYFGTVEQLGGNTGIPMLEDRLPEYECLAKDELHGLETAHLRNTYQTRLPRARGRTGTPASPSRGGMYLHLNCEGWQRFGPFELLSLQQDPCGVVDERGTLIARWDGECWRTSDPKFANVHWSRAVLCTSPEPPRASAAPGTGQGGGTLIELSQRMTDWLCRKQELLAPGKTLPDLPAITVSDEDPPAFVADPRLKALHEEDVSREATEAPLDTEQLLGCYISKSRQIVIWRKGVEFCTRRLGVDYSALFDCVLAHELGHWFNAEALTANDVAWNPKPLELGRGRVGREGVSHPDWRTPNASLPELIRGDARSLSSRCFHEAWAQFFAWSYGTIDSMARGAFEALEPRQSAPYRAWRELFSGKAPHRQGAPKFSEENILKSLEYSREPGTPATFYTSAGPGKGMLEWVTELCFAKKLKSKIMGEIYLKL